MPKKSQTWIYITLGIFAVGILFFLISGNFTKQSSDNNLKKSTGQKDTLYIESPKISPYYNNMKHTVDSFQVFLTSYKDSEVKQLKEDMRLKTGDNPFETLYQNEPTGDSNNFITVTNKTGYDMVLLENTVAYDSIKIPRSAHFIKAGERLEINFNSRSIQAVFNVYLGKKWATFQTTENKSLFVRNGSIVEYRFSQLAPQAKDILDTDYDFVNNAVIFYANGSLRIDKKG